MSRDGKACEHCKDHQEDYCKTCRAHHRSEQCARKSKSKKHNPFWVWYTKGVGQ